ncbi:MAG: ORF6N domain-containing protein [Candidatus Margulisbacteria bacterium]|nr:ORF6N domain-containing protein [Candidatus Margulisiibacteriota bacterium]
MSKEIFLSQDVIEAKIYVFRGMKVMLDRDLAVMYGVETRSLNQAVKRAIDRFPLDFMFQLTLQEFEDWKSQIVISNSEKMGLRKLPYVFTEQGVAMLSSVLRSPRAIAVNVQIMRIFVQMRRASLTNHEILLKLQFIEKQLLVHDVKHRQNDQQFQVVFEAIKHMFQSEIKEKKIGFL